MCLFRFQSDYRRLASHITSRQLKQTRRRAPQPIVNFLVPTLTAVVSSLSKMIRRDYILRMIEEFMQALNRIRGLKQGQDWQTAGAELNSAFQRLVGGGPQAVAALSETELIARLVSGEFTHLVHEKALTLARLFKEAGHVATS